MENEETVIICSKIIMHNFKGASDLEINLKDDETSIYGANGKLKTTIFDAFEWARTGKDHQNKPGNGSGAMDIKPLDSHNYVLNKVDYSVELFLTVNGTPLKVKRILNEDWRTDDATGLEYLKGHSTKYIWNGATLKTQKEYDKRFNDILNESMFKLLTNPMAFNILAWEKRREIVIALIGGQKTDSELMYSDGKKYEHLISILEQKSIQDYQAELKANINLQDKTLRENKIRLDENILALNAIDVFDFADLRASIKLNELKIAGLKEKISDKSKVSVDFFKNKTILTNKIGELQQSLNFISSELKLKLQTDKLKKSNDIKTLESSIKNIEKEIKESEAKIKEFEIQLAKEEGVKAISVKKWYTENDSVFTMAEGSLTCAYCKEDFRNPDNIKNAKANLLKNFNENKNKNIKSIEDEGNGLKTKITETELKIKEEKENIATANKMLTLKKNELTALNKLEDVADTLDDRISKNKEYQKVSLDLTSLEAKLATDYITTPVVDNVALNESITSNETEIKEIETKLNNEKSIKDTKKRIAEINENSKEVAKLKAEMTGHYKLVLDFNTLKINDIEPKVNSLFETVKFKLFDVPIDGTPTPTCQSLVNGVPWQSANSAAQIQSGIEIVNKLSEYKKIYAPMFVDNRESITTLPDSKSQRINLIVFPDESNNPEEKQRAIYEWQCESIIEKNDILLNK